MNATAHSQSNFSSNLIGLGVVVFDLDRSVDFYVNGIGMVKAYSFTINVKALNPVIERLKEKNVKLLGGTPTPLNEDFYFVLVQDPDGIFIEIIGPLE